MSNQGAVNIDIKARADAGQLNGFNNSLADLQRRLTQAKKDFATAAPDSEQYMAAVQAVGQLTAQIQEVLRPMRQFVENQAAAALHTERMNAMLSAGINPWTTASASYRAAQSALMAEAEAARKAAEAQELLNHAKAAEVQSSKAEAVASAQRQMAADLRAAEAATARLAVATKRVNDEQERIPKTTDPAKESARNMGLSVLMFSQALEDAQYGIRGVLNNIPGLVLAMGGGPGLAGAISVAAVTLSQLSNAFGSFDWDGTWIGDALKGFARPCTRHE